jgi:Spy/CpxP family protein refolding chaperone
MNKSKKPYITLAIILMACASLIIAKGTEAMPGKGGPGGPNPLMHCINQLGLSTDTLAKIDALLQTQRETMDAERDTMKAARDTYFTALTTVPQDSAALEQAQEALIALHTSHEQSRFSLDSSIVALLSADEAAQLGECLITTQPEPPAGPSAGDNGTTSGLAGKIIDLLKNGK